MPIIFAILNPMQRIVGIMKTDTIGAIRLGGGLLNFVATVSATRNFIGGGTWVRGRVIAYA